MAYIFLHVGAIILCFLQPVGFVTFATKDDAEAAKLELQVLNLSLVGLMFASSYIQEYRGHVPIPRRKMCAGNPDAPS